MKGIIIAIIVIAFLGAFGSCGGSNNSSSSNYNGRYGNGEKYDRNIDEIADAFEEDPDVVNDKINRVADEMNRY